jgi:hypothetical protein
MDNDLEKIAREFKEALDKYWELLVKIIEHKTAHCAEPKDIKDSCSTGRVKVDCSRRIIEIYDEATGDYKKIPFKS